MGAIRGFEGTATDERASSEPTTRAIRATKRGVKLWSKYEQILDLIDMGVSRLLIRSANGIGKSTLLATIIVDEITQHDNIAIIITGANATAVKQTLWAPVKAQAKKCGVDTSDMTANEWSPMPGRIAKTLAPSKVESAQGQHAGRVVVVIDEATSMDSAKISALQSNCTGNDTLEILTYNPLNPDAAVHDLEEQSIQFETLLNEEGSINREAVAALEKTKFVSVGISAFEHPNVINGDESIPGAVTRRFVEVRCAMDSVECSPLYPGAVILDWCHKAYQPTPELLARVCGQWSESITQGFISGSVVVNSWKALAKTGLKIAGADIGAGEDPTVWTSFHGNVQMPFESLSTGELGVIANALHDYCIDNDIDALGLDDTGVGHGVTDRLQEKKPKYKIFAIHFSAAAKNFPEIAVRKPANARCEMYLLLEKEMRAGDLRIIYDKELQKELCIQKTSMHTQSEKLTIEDKKLIKRRLGRSPNKADATAIARYTSRLLNYYTSPMLY